MPGRLAALHAGSAASKWRGCRRAVGGSRWPANPRAHFTGPGFRAHPPEVGAVLAAKAASYTQSGWPRAAASHYHGRYHRPQGMLLES